MNVVDIDRLEGLCRKAEALIATSPPFEQVEDMWSELAAAMRPGQWLRSAKADEPEVVTHALDVMDALDASILGHDDETIRRLLESYGGMAKLVLGRLSTISTYAEDWIDQEVFRTLADSDINFARCLSLLEDKLLIYRVMEEDGTVVATATPVGRRWFKQCGAPVFRHLDRVRQRRRGVVTAGGPGGWVWAMTSGKVVPVSRRLLDNPEAETGDRVSWYRAGMVDGLHGSTRQSDVWVSWTPERDGDRPNWMSGPRWAPTYGIKGHEGQPMLVEPVEFVSEWEGWRRRPIEAGADSVPASG